MSLYVVLIKKSTRWYSFIKTGGVVNDGESSLSIFLNSESIDQPVISCLTLFFSISTIFDTLIDTGVPTSNQLSWVGDDGKNEKLFVPVTVNAYWVTAEKTILDESLGTSKLNVPRADLAIFTGSPSSME